MVYGNILNVVIDQEMKVMRPRIVLILCLVIGFALQGHALNFKQIAYIPYGIIWGGGYMKALDFNRDGYQDLVLRPALGTAYNMSFWGYRPYNRYILEDSSVHSSEPWDAGFLDNDSLYDVVSAGIDTNGYNCINVYEQPDPNSLPTRLVWSWRYEYRGTQVSAMYITDLDKDGFREILTADYQVIYVFETRGDNQYVKVFSDSETLNGYVTPYFAVGDFDNDGQMEFVHGSYGGAPQGHPTVIMRKCVGNDQYQICWMDTLNDANMQDVITCPDLNGDGKLKFLIGGYHLGASGWTATLHLYESTGINQFAQIFSDSITGLSDRGVFCRRSDCGDIDRDGKPELVWAIDRGWMVYKYDSLGHRFQQVFRLGDNGHNSTNIHTHDMNGNGSPEIIESGGNETHIWEVEACRLVYPNGGETLYGDSFAVIRWRNVAPFQADSFSLFYSSDSGLTYSPVAHGIPGADSAYTWTVPKTFSDDCFVMLWAYQNATGWDFSDSPFRIRDGTGVEVPSHVSPLTSHLPYRVAPNPFVSFATLPGHEKEQFTLYDVSGRKVGIYKGDRIGFGLSAGIYFLKPEREGANPLRVVKLR